MTDSALPIPLSPFRTYEGLIITSGQVGIERATGNMPESFADQVKIALENLRHTLEQAGVTPREVLKTTVFIVNRDDFATMNDLYREAFAESYPARSTVICDLVLPGLLFEIEAVAHTR